jgi:hypothetical protein
MDINPENWTQFKSAIQNLIPSHKVDDIFIAVTARMTSFTLTTTAG